MAGLVTALPRLTWLWIIRKTLLVVGTFVVISLVTTGVVMAMAGAQPGLVDLAVSVAMPVVLGMPATLSCAIGIEKLRHANGQLTRLASLDGLTGMLNRGAFTAEVERHCELADSRGVLLVIDADHFKTVNDRFGHDVGDQALRTMADAIARTLGGAGFAGRLGGEEFGAYLPTMRITEAAKMTEAIRKAISELDFAPDGVACPLSVSIGGVEHRGPSPYNTLYRTADRHLYQAKGEGRDRAAIARAA